MRYVLECRVTNLFEKQGQRHISGAGKDAVTEGYSLGWFITVDNKLSICVGDDKPDLTIGQQVQIIVQSKPPRTTVEPTPLPPAPPGYSREEKDVKVAL